jgi:glycosyltransferase involved in cell wall biosynthesis
MKKLLIINSTLERSGLTSVIYNLVKYLDTSKIEIHILTLSAEPKFSRLADFKSLPIFLHSIELKGLKRYFGLGKSVQPIIEKIAPNYIHSFAFRGVLAAVFSQSGIPIVSTIQADLEKNYKVDYGIFAGKLLSILELHFIKRANIITVCSDSLLEIYKGLGPLKYIPNGVSTIDYKPFTQDEKLIGKEKLQLTSFCKVFISTGILNERKDPITIIRAFKKLNNPKWAFILLGDGPLMDNCKKESEGFFNIFIIGKVNDVRSYLGASDIFISASRSEGLPNAALEAGFMGLNLLLSNMPSHQEIMRNASQGISLFEVGDVAGLTELMHLGSLDNAKLDKKFTAKEMALSFQEIYFQ